MIDILVMPVGSEQCLGEIESPHAPRVGEFIKTRNKLYQVKVIYYEVNDDFDSCEVVSQVTFVTIEVEEVK